MALTSYSSSLSITSGGGSKKGRPCASVEQ